MTDRSFGTRIVAAHETARTGTAGTDERG
jgi:hypothetical protein